MQPDQQLIDSIYRERILRARAMSPGEKLMEGFRLFEQEFEERKATLRQWFSELRKDSIAAILQAELDEEREERYRILIKYNLPPC